MKIAFHINHLDLRGTGVAVFDFASHCESLLGHESVIICPSVKVQPRFQSELATDRFERRFEVYRYDNFDAVDGILKDLGADVFYAIKAGHRDHVVSRTCKNLVHAVFQHKDPHGEVYAYFSRWLSAAMSGGELPWVAPMVSLAGDYGDLRNELGIPDDAVVFGRHGGFPSFDIPFVHRTVLDVATRRSDIYFVFLNTQPFCEAHPNIIHLPATSDVEQKVRFIDTCDAMLHARRMGESFGLAIAEFSVRNRPVITYAGGTDRAHLAQLGDTGLYYRSEEELLRLLLDFAPDQTRDWDVYSREYAPAVVMERFRSVFLEERRERPREIAGNSDGLSEIRWVDPILLKLGPSSKAVAAAPPRPGARPATNLQSWALPIGFGIPEELFVDDPRAHPKTRYAAVVTPLDRETYIYPPTPEGEEGYLAQYRESFFGVTCKKGGWDCMRHYEILSQACMPWFFDIAHCPRSCLVDLPKDLLHEVLSLPGCALDRSSGQVSVDPDRFDAARYWELLQRLWNYARTHLTTTQLARRMLERAGVSDCRRVLVLSVQPQSIDYLGGMLLHGLRNVPGLNVTDYPRMDYMYMRPDRPHDHCEPNMWGMGFSLAHRLPEPESIDRSDLSDRIRAGEFDLAVFVDAGAMRPERPLPLWKLITACLPRERVLLVDGQDGPSRKLARYKASGIIFMREQAD